MFSVKWVTHHSESDSETEVGIDRDLDELVSFYISRLATVRMHPSGLPPDGFLVYDAGGKEVRRWFGSSRTSNANIAVRQG